MLRTEKYLRIIAAVAFLALGAYAAAFIWQKSDNSAVTEKAVYETVNESFSVSGRAYRDFVSLDSDGGDYIILAAEGEYLSGGSPVAVKKENADEYFAYCDYRLCKKLFASEKDAVSAIKSGDAALRAWAVLYLEGRKPPEKMDRPKGLLRAPCAGFYTRLGSDLGSIACGTNWYFSFESEKISLLNEGQKLNLDISSGPETEAEVFSIDKENGSAVLVIRSCADFIPQDTEYSAKVALSGCTGIKVPAKAMHFDDDGAAFVYVLSAGTKEKLPVEIIYTSTSRNFFLCEERSLREGMDLLISGATKAGVKNGHS